MKEIVLPGIDDYAVAHTSREDSLLAAVATETRATMESAEMMVGRIEGRLLEMLVHLADARQVLEIGTFTGYSALAMAAALPPGGRLVTCEVDPEHAAIAGRHIQSSPYADSVEIKLGPALDTISTLAGPFDFVFIDADKANYRNYYEAVLPLLAPRGVIAVDNVLWSGRVLNARSDADDDDTRAIAEFNEHVAGDPRVVCVMLTVRDGVTLIRRS